MKSSVSLLHVPAAISLSTDGIVWMLTGAAATAPHVPFAGVMHVAISGDVVSLATANVILPRGGKRAVIHDAAMIRLANGSLIPLSQAHFLRMTSGAIVPLNLAVIVRLYDGCHVALAGGFAVQLQNGTLIPLATAGELRLKSGIAVPLFGCVGPQPGCLQLCPAPFINRKGPAPQLHRHPPFAKKKMKKFGQKFHPGKKGPGFKGKPKFRKFVSPMKSVE